MTLSTRTSMHRAILPAAAALMAGLWTPTGQAGDACQEMWDLSMGGPNKPTESLGVFDDGQGGGPALYVGGYYEFINGMAANRIAKWNGATWEPLGTGLQGDDVNLNGTVSALLPYDDGTGPALYVGGQFDQAGPVVALRIARWDGQEWSSVGIGFNAKVKSLAAFDDGNGPALYAGGDFGQSAQGTIVGCIAKWDGTDWLPVSSGVSGYEPSVMALATFDDGSGKALYAAGQFDAADGQLARHIARWDGSTWTALGSGLNKPGRALIVFDHDGDGTASLIVGGNFTIAGGNPANRVAAWDGTSWSALGNGTPADIVGFALFDAGNGTQLYATGFGAGFWRFDGGQWEVVGNGITTDGRALLAFDDGSGGGADLYIAGAITTVGGTPAPNFARWNGCAVGVDADLNGDGTVDAADLGILLGGWGSPRADLDGDGTTDATDLALLLGAWSG